MNFTLTALRGKSAMLAGAGVAALSLAVFATPAYAQDAEATPCVDADDDGACDPTSADGGDTSSGAIVVTGSRIARPDLESTVPITSIAGDSFLKQGDPNIGETLNELPQLRSTFAQQNPALGIGIAGLNLLDLRGLGTARTLVLVNGRRHVPADILSTAASVDINTIPNDLVERVDIVTGGNSAVYGSDAIAGVVNFVLRREFDGFQIRGNSSVSDEGFGGNQYLSAMFGTNFGGDRGNVTLHGEYSHQDRVFGSQLPWLRQVNTFAVVDADPSGLTAGSDGFPDNIFVRDLRSASINRFGLIPISQPGENPATAAAEARCGVGIGQTNGGTSSIGVTPATSGQPYNCTLLFNPDGTLVTQTGSRIGAGIIGGILGGNGQTGREDQLLSVLPENERFNFNLLAHYEFTPNIEAFIEAKFARTKTQGNNAGATGIQGTFGQFDFRERARLDNPFLTTAQRTEIANQILLSGCNTSLTVACATAAGAPAARSTAAGQGVGGPLSAADIAAINAGTYRFVIARNLSDLAIRDEVFTRDTYRMVAGLRGTFNTDWNFEVSGNYGEFRQNLFTVGYIDRQRLMLSLDAGRNPATGQIQCRSQFDPAAAIAFDTGAFQTGGTTRRSPSQQARLAADIAACVPYNAFGAANNSAATQYFGVTNRTQAKFTQFVANAFVGGDLSQVFELPGGPVGFVLGAEYRRQTASYIDDPFVAEGDGLGGTQTNTNNVVISNFLPPPFIVREAFGELRIPLLRDTPLFEELTVSGAARYSDYKGAGNTGGVWAYNGGVDWAPIRDIRFRANYSRAVRAPNQSELFFPLVPNFAPSFVDPCSPNSLSANPNRPANCLAEVGGNAAVLAAIPNVTQSLNVLSGSNPLLKEETSDSITIGAVIRPRWIPGLAVSVDYFDIKVKDVIVSLTAQQIANNCVDQPTNDNVFCDLFERYLGPTPGPLAEVQGQIKGNTLIQAGVNFAARERRGIDFNVSYRTNLSDNVRLNTNLIYVRSLKNSNFENPALPDFENRILGELGDPKNEFRLDVDLGVGGFTGGYRMRYIGPMWTAAYENFNELPTACTTPTTCPPLNADILEPQKTPAVFYHDVRFEYELEGGQQIFAGIDNLLDTKPPLGITGTSAINTDRGPQSQGTGAIYDAFGRRLYVGFKFPF